MFTTKLRFSKQQTLILKGGLRRIYLNEINRRMTGYLHDCHLSLIVNRSLKFGVYDKKLMDTILDFYRSAARGRGFRVNAGYMEVSSLLLAARNCRREIRHGHLVVRITRFDRSIDQLIRKLELHQKRLKRLIVIDKGRGEFAALSRSWRQFRLWVKMHLNYCPCMRREPSSVHRQRRARLNYCYELVCKELANRYFEVVDPKGLRDLIRRALEDVRRGRTPHLMYKLTGDAKLATKFLMEFIEERIPELKS